MERVTWPGTGRRSVTRQRPQPVGEGAVVPYARTRRRTSAGLSPGSRRAPACTRPPRDEDGRRRARGRDAHGARVATGTGRAPAVHPPGSARSARRRRAHPEPARARPRILGKAPGRRPRAAPDVGAEVEPVRTARLGTDTTPTRSAASSTRMSRSRRRQAAASPAMPAPTTTASLGPVGSAARTCTQTFRPGSNGASSGAARPSRTSGARSDAVAGASVTPSIP